MKTKKWKNIDSASGSGYGYGNGSGSFYGWIFCSFAYYGSGDGYGSGSGCGICYGFTSGGSENGFCPGVDNYSGQGDGLDGGLSHGENYMTEQELIENMSEYKKQYYLKNKEQIKAKRKKELKG